MDSTTPAVPKAPRYHELDSLRGVAALTVVFHHFRQMWTPATGHFRWLNLLNPITAGHEAVMLFFLLSGFVLAVPYIRGKRIPYKVYLARRILRIYGPYLAALLLAVIGASIWHTPLMMNAWSNATWSEPVRAGLILQHVLFIGNYNWEQFNTAFWSLIVEMRISIVFPLLFLLVSKLRARTALFFAVLLAVAVAGVLAVRPEYEKSLRTVQYASIFLCGIVLAINLDQVNAWYQRLTLPLRFLLVATSFVLYSWGHMLQFVIKQTWSGDMWLITLGAAGYLILSLNMKPIRQLLSSVAARFLGRISYSLYLVHGTILFTLTHLCMHAIGPILQFPVYLALCVSLGYLFCIGVEEPFLHLGRKIGRPLPTNEAQKPLSLQKDSVLSASENL